MMFCSAKQLMGSLLVVILVVSVVIGEPPQRSGHSPRPRLKSSTDDFFLAAPELFHLIGVPGDDLVDHNFDSTDVGDLF